jgi:hypothetical protein
MIQHILTTNEAKLEKITLCHSHVNLEFSISVERIADNENMIEFLEKKANGDVQVLNTYVGSEDLILFMRNIEQFISRNCCKNSLPDFSEI